MAKQGTRTRLSWHFCEADLEKTRETTLAEEFALLADSIHSDILHSIERNDFDGARTLLESCQGTAVQIGLALERADSEGAPAVGFLEEYCEQIWQLYNRLGTKPLSMERAAEDINRLHACLKEKRRSAPASSSFVGSWSFRQRERSVWDSPLSGKFISSCS